MNKTIEVAVYLPDEDAKRFLVFQQYYEPISVLIDKGVFNQKSASVTLNFDHTGKLQTVQRIDLMYTAKFPDIIPNAYGNVAETSLL